MRRRLWRRASGAVEWLFRSGLVFVLIFGVAGWLGLQRLDDVRQDGIAHVTAQARRSDQQLRRESKARAREICSAANRAIEASRTGFDRFRAVLVGFAGPDPPPAQRAQIEAFNVRIRTEVIDELVLIDCQLVAEGASIGAAGNGDASTPDR